MATDRDLRASFDREAPTYDEATNTFHHAIQNHLTLHNLLEELPEDRALRILDAGGGTGRWSLELARRGYQPRLCDISPVSVDMARKKAAAEGLSLDCLACDAEHTPFADASFDFIMMNGGVVSYTSDPAALLAEASRLLAPGGKLVMDFLNAVGWGLECPDPAFRAELAASEERLIQMPDWDYPARVFSPARMEALLAAAGFTVTARYGLVLLSTSLPMDLRYAKAADPGLLERYLEAELKMSMRPDRVGASWSCMFSARKA